MSNFFKVLSLLSPQFITFSEQFPSTLYKFHKMLGTQKDTFIRYVTCTKCSMVYKYADCIKSWHNNCTKTMFHNRAQICNGSLLRRVELANKRRINYPCRVYCYMPLYNYMVTLLNSPGFPDLFDQWKRDESNNAAFNDVFNGKDFQ